MEKIHRRETLSAVILHHGARQKHGRLKSKPELLETSNTKVVGVISSELQYAVRPHCCVYLSMRETACFSPYLLNQLPSSLRQPHSGDSSSICDSPIPLPITSSWHSAHPLLPLSLIPGLKPTCFTNPTSRSFTSSSRTAFADYCPNRFF